MKTRSCVLLAIALLLVSLTAVSTMQVNAWSNGSYSTSPPVSGYGTHDWIAQHALDFLPISEKQFILDNLASYLYGTELPDNRNTPGGVGDTNKHHVYFFTNRTLQDDSSAVRAREELANAQQLYNSGNYSGAAEHLGMVAHYIGDMAVFGHMMGSSTAWGTEIHHGDYESYVLTRTRNYTSEFAFYIIFDGRLEITSAYDAALMVAYDTTFDPNGNQPCTWMDTFYNWSDPAFRTRVGKSLNLAVNTMADVLHTFNTIRAIPEFPFTIVNIVLVLVVSMSVIAVCRDKKVQDKNSVK